MNDECYLYRSRMGDVTISENKEHPSEWDLCIAGKLIYPGYRSPEEAAYKASRRDFGDEELEQTYIGLRVPADLAEWTTCDLAKIGV